MHAGDCQNSNQCGSKRSAFTLVEIMAATAIMVVVILVVMGLTSNVLTSWNRASGELSSNLEGRVALDLLAQDLESIVLKDDGNVWLDVRYRSIQGMNHQTHLMFFASVPDRPLRQVEGGSFVDIPGDVCAVQYLTQFKNPFASSGVNTVKLFGLYRAVVDAENTFKTAMNPASTSSVLPDHLMDFWAATAGFGSQAVDAGGQTVSAADFLTWATGQSNYLSSNIVDFRTVFYYRNANNQVKPLVDTAGNPLEFVYVNGVQMRQSSGYVPLADSEPGAQLQYVDVTLTVLSDQGGRLLSSIIQGIDIGEDMNREQVLIEHASTYTRRIYLVSKPF